MVVTHHGALSAFPLTGESQTIPAAPAALAIEDDALLSVEGKSLMRRSLPALASIATTEAPEEFQALAAGPKRQLLGGTPKQLGVWKFENDRWQKLDVPFRVTSVSFGKDNTIWLTGQEIDSGKDAAGQFAPDGAFLRKYYDGFAVRRIQASAASDEIAILEGNDAGVTRFRVLRQEGKAENGEVAWKILLEKSITPCERFGIVDGRLVADAGSTPSRMPWKPASPPQAFPRWAVAPRCRPSATTAPSGLRSTTSALCAWVISPPPRPASLPAKGPTPASSRFLRAMDPWLPSSLSAAWIKLSLLMPGKLIFPERRCRFAPLNIMTTLRRTILLCLAAAFLACGSLPPSRRSRCRSTLAGANPPSAWRTA